MKIVLKSACLLAFAVFSLQASAAVTSVKYTCQQKKSVRVVYEDLEATAYAKVKVDGKLRKLQYSDESNAETSVYKDGAYVLNLDNTQANKHKATLINIGKNTDETVNGEKMPVYKILYKDCSPGK